MGLANGELLAAAQLSTLKGKVENMSYVGVLHSNEMRRGYDIARQEFIHLIDTKE